MRRKELTVMIAGITVLCVSSLAAAEDSSHAAGQAIYDSYCGACHGFNGAPLLPNTPSFASGERLEKPDSELLESIRAGKGKSMPGWFGILDEEQCEEVLKFIRNGVGAGD